MATGRPTKYDPKYCDMLVEHMSEGLSFESFAGVVGVCFDTVHEWAKVHPEFSDAKRRGRAAGLNYDERLLNRGAQGKVRGYNINAHKWKMANMHKWRDRQEVSYKSTAEMTDEELIREAQRILSEATNVPQD